LSSRDLPIGVIGVGSLGYHHARILSTLPGARLAGIFDIDALRAGQVAAELGTHAFPSLEALLDGVEAAIVSVPTSAHAEVATVALGRGIHLLIEKPLARTLAEADAILAAAERSGALVATGHVERFNAALRGCEPYLDEPRFIETHRLSPFGPRGTDVAVVLDLMIHDIDLILALVRQPVESVDAVGVPVLTPNVDIANARLRFEGGVVANITASRVSQERMRKIRFFQPSGYISLDLARGTGEFLRLREGAQLGVALASGSLVDIVERIEITGDAAEPLRCELEAFVGAVRGEREMVVTGRDGREALAVALEIAERTEADVAAARPA
jgi:predicted dehydrogenase